MNEKTASVLWTGSGPQGRGQVSTESGALLDYPFGVANPAGVGRRDTNPEEILGAALAASFAMVFSLACDRAGYPTISVDTQAHVRRSPITERDGEGDGNVIDRIALHLDAAVPTLDDARFQALARAALKACPLCKALAGVPEITLKAVLNAGAAPALG